MKTLSFILIALLGFSCTNHQSSDQTKNYSSQSYLNTLQKRKALLDRDTSKQIVEFDKMKNKAELVRVLKVNGNYPDEGLDYSYFVLMNRGKVIAVSYDPLGVSENGNWVLKCKHYFDADGHTFAFEKEVATPILPNDDLAVETTTDYFDPQFKSIKHISKLVDTNQKSVDTNRVDTNIIDRSYALNFLNKIYPTSAECLAAYHIKL